MVDERINKSEYFMKFARLASKRSTCLKRQVGAVIIKDDMIISTGYNGAPRKYPHCIDLKCKRVNVESGTHFELCIAVHAEQNAIVQAARNGVSTLNTIMYTTHQPCSICAKLIAQAGIVKVIFENEYPDEFSMEIFKTLNIECIKYDDKIKKR